MNKKGFTLIEIIAVIIILGILAFIAIPQVMNAIENSEKNGAIVSANRYVEAVNNDIADRKMKRENMISDGVKTLDDLSDIKVDGEIPTSATLVVKDDSIIYSEIVVGDYTVTCTEYDGCSAIKGYYIYFANLGLGFSSLPNNVDNYKERPNDKNVYLKYPVEGGKLETPQICIYNDNLEFCLNSTDDNQEIAKKTKKYFEYDENTWKAKTGENPNKKYKPGGGKYSYCIVSDNDSTIECRNYYIGIRNDSYILVSDFPKLYGCAVTGCLKVDANLEED